MLKVKTQQKESDVKTLITSLGGAPPLLNNIFFA